MLTHTKSKLSNCSFPPEIIEVPGASLSNGHNGHIDVQLYLPDRENGFYRGTRFEWAGVIRSLRYRGHECFGQWKKFHSPQYPDCITGSSGRISGGGDARSRFPSCEGGRSLFAPPRRAAHNWSGEFVRFSTYPILDASGWTITQSRRQLRFQHSALSFAEMGYRFQKLVSVEENAPRQSLLHRIENTGRIPIDTRHYYHNFLCMDGVPPGALPRTRSVRRVHRAAVTSEAVGSKRDGVYSVFASPWRRFQVQAALPQRAAPSKVQTSIPTRVPLPT